MDHITTTKLSKNQPYLRRLGRDLRVNGELYLLFIPVLAYYIMFHYAPMYGASIAFKDYTPTLGISGSPWVGFKHFNAFFNSYYFWNLLRNTLNISLTSLIVGFPIPIIFALLINELRSKRYARVVQTVTYIPHFVSLVVVCGMIREFTSNTGLVTQLLSYVGFRSRTMLNDQSLFVPVYVISGIWQEAGWGSIIYLAALTSIDQELYEAAEIDGANRFRRVLHITIPGILPTVVIMFIMQTGKLMSVGADKVILLYNPAIYETADVISSYVYRRGIRGTDWSFSSAVGLFNSLINFILVVSVNAFSRRLTHQGLW